MSPRITSTLATAALALAAFHGTAAAEPLTCEQIQLAANIFNSQIVDKLSECSVGEEFRINNRKSVRLDGVSSLTVQGCEITAVVAVTLKRKLLRDLHGTVTARATAAVDNQGNNVLKVAFDGIRMSSVDLDDVGGFREWIFERVANRTLPSTYAITIDLNPGDGDGDSCSLPR